MVFAGDDWSENWNYDPRTPRTPWTVGTGYGSTEPEPDVVDALHAVVEEVTGKPVAKPPRRPIGFF